MNKLYNKILKEAVEVMDFDSWDSESEQTFKDQITSSLESKLAMTPFNKFGRKNIGDADLMFLIGTWKFIWHDELTKDGWVNSTVSPALDEIYLDTINNDARWIRFYDYRPKGSFNLCSSLAQSTIDYIEIIYGDNQKLKIKYLSNNTFFIPKFNLTYTITPKSSYAPKMPILFLSHIDEEEFRRLGGKNYKGYVYPCVKKGVKMPGVYISPLNIENCLDGSKEWDERYKGYGGLTTSPYRGVFWQGGSAWNREDIIQIALNIKFKGNMWGTVQSWGTEKIGAENCSPQAIYIPKKITEIPEGAFANYKDTEELAYDGKSLSNTGYNAFFKWWCLKYSFPNIQDINDFRTGVLVGCSDSALRYITNGLKICCPGIEKVVRQNPDNWREIICKKLFGWTARKKVRFIFPNLDENNIEY